MNDPAKQAAKTTKDLAQKIARQMAQEPFEVLKKAETQVAGEQVSGEPQVETSKQENQQKIAQNQKELQDKAKSSRRMEALQREVEDIRKQKLFKELQNKITAGEEVALENYPELSMEQKQVLKAQMEAVKKQMLNAKYANDKSLVEPATKKGRQLFNFGKKTEMKREQTHVEKIIPPSA
jgi:hypothetical protein